MGCRDKSLLRISLRLCECVRINIFIEKYPSTLALSVAKKLSSLAIAILKMFAQGLYVFLIRIYLNQVQIVRSQVIS